MVQPAPDAPVRVLGPVELRTPTGDAVVPSALARRLLVALVLAGPQGRSADRLIEDVWGDEPPGKPRGALQMLVSRVRDLGADGVLTSNPSGYAIADSDLAAAEAAAAAPRGGVDAEARLTAALALWRGEPGADLDVPELADDLRARAARAQERLRTAHLDAAEAAGDIAAALEDAERLLDARPLDAALVARRMRLLEAAGRPNDAVAAFAEHRRRLADELGLDPEPALVDLNAALLRRTGGGRAELVGVRAASTPLIGREEDLTRLAAAVRSRRLVTILGPGGLGKTRLAHAAAFAVQDEFERIAFVELAGTTSAEDVALAVGATLDARVVLAPRRLGDRPPPDLVSRIVGTLQARRTLLILDNCEHVIDAAARLAADLLAAVPSLTVLTTSRVGLLLPGETVLSPAPLPPATAAAQLFRERAAAARPGVPLDQATVERICEHLDGLPLALELAAARLRSMTLAELDERLADRFAVLVGADRTAPDRHRTLFAVIDWSWRLLAPESRRALQLLAIFPDGFAVDGASSLLGGDATGTLTDLVDQSLLTFAEASVGRGRYRMLETVREFGLRALAETGETATAQRALDRFALAFCRRIAPGLTGGIDPAASTETALEEETLLTVLRRPPAGREPAVLAVFALLAEFWIYRGEFERVPELLPAVTAAGTRRPESEQEREEALRALTLAAAFAALNRSPAATRVLALLARVRRTLSPDASGFWPTFSGALLVRQTGQEALADLQRLSTSEDPLIATFTTLLAGQLSENTGRVGDALIAATRSRRLAERHGLTWFRLVSTMSMAQLHSQRARREEGLRLALAAADEIATLGVRADLAQLDWVIAANEVALGRLDDAEVRFARLAETSAAGSSGDARDKRAIGLAGLAEVAAARGDTQRALAAWTATTEVAERATVPWRIVVRGAALAAEARLGPPDGAPPGRSEAAYRRLRGRVLALSRFPPEQVDVPVFASGALGLAAVLQGPHRSDEQRAVGAELVALAVPLGARLDFPSLEAVPGVAAALAGDAADPDPDRRVRGIVALLRSPAARL